MKINQVESIEEYFTGDKLFGDNFSDEEIQKWYKDEEEGYANLGNNNQLKYQYQYFEMNERFGFKYIDKSRKFKNVLGIGSAFGHEFLPIINQINELTILEPSEQLRSEQLGDIKPTYIKPNFNGKLDFSDNSFDLIVCFSVLHHIPNVGYVLSEINRVLSPGGILMIREPIVSMGDWRYPRRGLTKNERGIPMNYFLNFIRNYKLNIISKKFCDCSFIYKVLEIFFNLKYDTRIVQNIDNFFANIFSWNYKYHRKSLLDKFAPASVFLVLKKK